MAKKKPAKKSKSELWQVRQAYLDSLPEKDLNPNWKEDFEKLGKAAVTPRKRSKA